MPTKRLGSLLIFLIILSGTAAPGAEKLFHIDGLQLEKTVVKEKTFVRVKVKGPSNGVWYNVGAPELPAIRFWVSGEGPIDITVGQVSLPQPTSLNGSVVPSSVSAPKRRGIFPKFEISMEAYQSNEFVPETFHTVQEVGTIRGERKRLVSLYPVQYRAATREVRWVSDFRVNLTEEQANGRIETSPHLVFAIGEKFASNQMLKTYYRWKQRVGFRVSEIVLEKGLSSEEVRARLLEHYRADPFSFLILVGDSEDIVGYQSPTLKEIEDDEDEDDGVPHPPLQGEPVKPPSVTDHYYACLDNEDFNSDVGTPDAAVGRLSAKNKPQLETILKKWVRYEQGYFASDNWLTSMSLIGTDDETAYTIAEGSFEYLVNHYTNSKGYLGTFPNSYERGGDRLYAITHKAKSRDVVSRLQQGRGFVNYGGHGLPTYWEGPEVKDSDVKSLWPWQALPLVIANACDTGKFVVDECFGETWLRHPQGASAYLGSMTATFWDEDDVFQRALYDAVFQQGQLRIGDFIHTGLDAVWTYYGGAGKSSYYWQTYELFGDPTMSFRTWRTREGKVVRLVDSSGDLIYQVLDFSGSPIAGASVSVLDEGTGVPSLLQTDSDGKVRFNRQGPFWLTVLGKNLRAMSVQVGKPRGFFLEGLWGPEFADRAKLKGSDGLN